MKHIFKYLRKKLGRGFVEYEIRELTDEETRYLIRLGINEVINSAIPWDSTVLPSQSDVDNAINNMLK